MYQYIFLNPKKTQNIINKEFSWRRFGTTLTRGKAHKITIKHRNAPSDNPLIVWSGTGGGGFMHRGGRGTLFLRALRDEATLVHLRVLRRSDKINKVSKHQGIGGRAVAAVYILFKPCVQKNKK